MFLFCACAIAQQRVVIRDPNDSDDYARVTDGALHTTATLVGGGDATAANQLTIIADVDQLEGYVDGLEALLTSIDDGTLVVRASAYDGSGTANDATHPIYVRQVTSTGAQPDDSAVDSALNAGENPVFVGGEYEASRAVIEDGDKGGLHFTPDQLLLTTTIDPCSDTASTTLAVSQADDAQLVAASGSTKVYVCSAVLVAGAAEVINFIEGTGSVCGTSTLAVVGSTTQSNGISLAANGGFSVGNGAASAFHTNTGGNALCLTQNSTSRVSGYITYVQK